MAPAVNAAVSRLFGRRARERIQRIDTFGSLKRHKNTLRTGNDDSDDSRCETLVSDGQKVETSPKSCNPGKTKVDPAFEDLSSTVQDFLQAQGITSALDLMAANANELAPAWIKWNKGAFKTTSGSFFLRENCPLLSMRLDLFLWQGSDNDLPAMF